MALWKAAPEEVRLEATAEDSHRWCRRDVVRQTVPNTGSGLSNCPSNGSKLTAVYIVKSVAYSVAIILVFFYMPTAVK